MLGTNYLALIYCLTVFHVYNTAGLSFTDGTALTKEFNHETTGGTTFTVTTAPAATFAVSGTDSSAFSVAPVSGATALTTATVTITNKLNYNSKSSYSFSIDATKSGKTVSLAVTLNVIKPVAFGSNSYMAKVCETATEGTEVTMVTATKHTGRTLTYTIPSGNTGTLFAISAAGLITVNTGKTVDKTVGLVYTLTVTATDNSTPAQSDTASVTVIVCGTCSGASTVTGSVAAMLCLLFSVFKKLV